MPYITVQSYPKDEETVKEVVERINQVFLDVWGCPQDAITIRMEQMPPEEWVTEGHYTRCFNYREVKADGE